MSRKKAKQAQRIDQIGESVRNLNEVYFDLRADYEAAQDNRFLETPKGVPTTGAGSDYHLRNGLDYYKIVERCRQLVRDDKIVGQGVRTLVRNVIQDGFQVSAATPDDKLNDELDERWYEWAEDKDRVDYRGEFNFRWMEKLTCAALVTDGDCSYNPLRAGSMQAFESHRMRSPSGKQFDPERLFLGVERSSDERRVRYWITRHEMNGYASRSLNAAELQSFDAYTADPITQRNEPSFFHVWCPWRLSQTRGIPPMAPIVVTAGMLADVDFATMVKHQVAAYFAVLRNIPESYTGEIKTGEEEEDPYREGRTRRLMDIAPGAEISSRIPGEKVEGFAPNIPSPAYFQHSHLLLSYISVNLDLPLMLLMLDASETNFSGWRGSFDQAKIRFKDFQSSIADMFHKNVRRWKLRQWLAQDARLRRIYDAMGERFFGAEWHFPVWPYIQPVDDTAAAVLQVRHGLTSMRRLCKTRNVDYPDLAKEIVDDTKLIIEKAIQAADELNGRYPDAHVDWREIYHPSPADNIQLALQPDQQGGSSLRPASNPKSGAPSNVGA